MRPALVYCLSMKRNITIAVVAAILGVCIYLFGFKTVSDGYIVSHGWKGEGCGLPAVLDFRNGALTLHENALYKKNILMGHIVERKYRPYADSYIDVLREETGETCRYWGKWTN